MPFFSPPYMLQHLPTSPHYRDMSMYSHALCRKIAWDEKVLVMYPCWLESNSGSTRPVAGRLLFRKSVLITGAFCPSLCSEVNIFLCDIT
jgi:hypothetical protein